MARKGVGGPDGGEVEVVQTRVVIGQMALVAKRGVDVHQPGLQRLAEGAAKVAGAALEDEAAVQAGSGQRPAGAAAAIAQLAVKLVAGGVHLQPGGEKAPGRRPGPGRLRVNVGAAGIGLAGEMGQRAKAGEVGFHGVVQRPGVAGARPAGGQLRQAVVRGDDGRVGVLQRLPLQGAGGE